MTPPPKKRKPKDSGQPEKDPQKKNTVLVIILSILIVLLIASIAFGIFLILKNKKDQDGGADPASVKTESQTDKDSGKKGESGKDQTEKGQSGSANQSEEARQSESLKQSEEARQSESVKQSEEARQSESTKQSEEARQSESAKQSEEARQSESARQSELAKQTEPVIEHSYSLIVGDYTWSDAVKYCEEHDGYLAAITSEDEQKQIEEELAKYPDIKVVWLGAENASTQGAFKWKSGEEFGYSKWAYGEPNNDQGIEHYLVMYYVEDEWVWNDAPNDITQYYSGKMGFLMETEKKVN